MTEVMDAIPLSAAALEASLVEAARALEAMAAAVGASSEADTSSGLEMVLMPSARVEPSLGDRVQSEEVQPIDDPLLSSQMVALILEMNQRVASYIEVNLN